MVVAANAGHKRLSLLEGEAECRLRKRDGTCFGDRPSCWRSERRADDGGAARWQKDERSADDTHRYNQRLRYLMVDRRDDADRDDVVGELSVAGGSAQIDEFRCHGRRRRPHRCRRRPGSSGHRFAPT